MSTSRLRALAVNTPEMEETLGRGGRETRSARFRSVPLRGWSSPANRARETRQLCTETCSNLPEPARSSVGLEKCPLRRWPEGKNGTVNVHLSYGSDAWMHVYVVLKCFLFIKKKQKTTTKDLTSNMSTLNLTEKTIVNVKHLNMSFCAWIRPAVSIEIHWNQSNYSYSYLLDDFRIWKLFFLAFLDSLLIYVNVRSIYKNIWI